MCSYYPLAYPCRRCSAAPGQRCIWLRRDGSPIFRRPHAVRVTAARHAVLTGGQRPE